MVYHPRKYTQILKINILYACVPTKQKRPFCRDLTPSSPWMTEVRRRLSEWTTRTFCQRFWHGHFWVENPWTFDEMQIKKSKHSPTTQLLQQQGVLKLMGLWRSGKAKKPFTIFTLQTFFLSSHLPHMIHF